VRLKQHRCSEGILTVLHECPVWYSLIRIVGHIVGVKLSVGVRSAGGDDLSVSRCDLVEGR
jgi:hypothetical protein